MKEIATIQGYKIYWSDPAYDGGHGTGEVMVGSDSAGKASTKADALAVATKHIQVYTAKLNR